MSSSSLIALLIALTTGFAITTQVTLSSISGNEIGPARTGFLIHFTGAAAALIFTLILTVRGQGIHTWGITRPVLIYMTIAGMCGIYIVAGAAFSLGKIGVAAGQATIIFGQMFLAILIDTFGWSGAAAIQLEPRRIVGIIVLGIAAWLLLPSK